MSKYLIFLLITIALIIPFQALAFNPVSALKGPIVSCGIKTDPDRNTPCTLCHIFEMTKNIIDFILAIIIFIAPLFILGGAIVILTSTGVPDRVGLGKKIITNAIIGLIIAFGAWTILGTVFNTLIGAGLEGGPIEGWAWYEVKCEVGGETEEEEEPIVEEGEYCVCEVPVFDLDPNDFPDEASVIAVNVEMQKLVDKATCKERCVSENYATYCPSTLKPDQANLYCAGKSYLENTKACSVELSSKSCRLSTTCYNSEQECLNDSTITYKSRCFLDGQNHCQCYTGSAKALCGNDPNKYVLYREKAEQPHGGENVSLWDCNHTANRPCRLDCQYVKCVTGEDKCNQLSNPGTCFGSYKCQKGIINQVGFASDELKKLLACMADKLPDGAKEISSIMDNSGGRCLQNWNSQCSTGQDSCEGTCCGHGRDSLHYGGDFDKRNKSACRINSWAVDFGKNTVSYKNEIESAAKECAEEIPILKEFGKGKKGVQVQPEGDHIHLELDGIARYYYKCM